MDTKWVQPWTSLRLSSFKDYYMHKESINMTRWHQSLEGKYRDLRTWTAVQAKKKKNELEMMCRKQTKLKNNTRKIIMY